MLIILGLLILTIIGAFITVKTEYRHEFISSSAFVVAVVSFIFFFSCSAYIPLNYLLNKNAETASYQQQYESLTYQLENIDTLYANSRANDKKELYNQIQEWNQTIAAGRARHNNLWINWFYPVNFNEFEFIELK